MHTIGKFKGYPFTQEGIAKMTEAFTHLFPFLVPYVDYVIHVEPSVYCGTICSDIGNLNILMLRQGVAWFPQDPKNKLSQVQQDFLDSIIDPKELGLKILLDEAKEEISQAEKREIAQKSKRLAQKTPPQTDQASLF
jgi:hypothetical protein